MELRRVVLALWFREYRVTDISIIPKSWLSDAITFGVVSRESIMDSIWGRLISIQTAKIWFYEGDLPQNIDRWRHESNMPSLMPDILRGHKRTQFMGEELINLLEDLKSGLLCISYRKEDQCEFLAILGGNYLKIDTLRAISYWTSKCHCSDQK